MGIINRDLGGSEKRHTWQETVSTVTGQTYALAVCPWPAILYAAQTANVGVSGSPNMSLWINRFIAGAGVTSFCVGQSMVVTTFGTSGPQGFTILPGVSAVILAGDVVSLSVAAANTATVATSVALVVEAVQDIKSHFGA